MSMTSLCSLVRRVNVRWNVAMGERGYTLRTTVALCSRAVRELFKRELIPARMRWWFAAEGMCEWYRVLARDLAPHLPNARGVLAELSVPMFRRRRGILGATYTHLGDA